MKTLIIGNGTIKSEIMLLNEVKKSEYIICADGGANHLSRINVNPNLLIGDFDSISPKLLEELSKRQIEIISYPKNKIYTDTELAIEIAIQKSATYITLMGVIGNRIDHTLSNIFLLNKIVNNGIKGSIINETNEIYLVDREIIIPDKKGYKLSIIPATDIAEGISSKGLLYPLDNVRMDKGTGIGISNEFIDKEALIEIKSGRIFVIIAKD